MDFVERGKAETLVQHLLRNADALSLSPDQLRRLKMAYRLEFGTRPDRNEAARIGLAVRDELNSEVRYLLAMAVDRGEVVSTFNDAGAKHVKSRDGLLLAYDSAALTGLSPADRKDPIKAAQGWMRASVLMHAGLYYREMHELTTASLGSQLGGLGQSSSKKASTDAMVWSMLDRAKMLKEREDIDAVLRSRPSARELKVLRLVAGEGRTIRSMSSGGKAVDLNKAALVRALRHVAKVLRSPGYEIV